MSDVDPNEAAAMEADRIKGERAHADDLLHAAQERADRRDADSHDRDMDREYDAMWEREESSHFHPGTLVPR